MKTIQHNQIIRSNSTQLRLIPGLHAALVTSPLEKAGCSIFAWEIYQACRVVGVPAILATFDQGRRYPDMGPDLHRVAVDGKASGIEFLGCLLPVIREAEAGGKLLIIDTKACLCDQIIEALEYGGIHQAASVAALIPIGRGLPSIYAAAVACEMFQTAGITFSRGLFRTWGPYRKIEPFGIPGVPRIDSWVATNLSPGALASIRNVGRVGEAPADLFPALVGSRKHGGAPKPSDEVRLHVLSAADAIRAAILAPICGVAGEETGAGLISDRRA